ncbi:protein AGAMOUS-LIKE 6-like isoform X6 [Apium graveolens]|uniref:protein AGAMOUS-LIKE 6-like isoform X6 n=1 Tax=Apium graveolens TaxID=4045 RepID=UPI003D7B3730
MAQAKKLVEGYLLRAAHRSDIFAHILIWHLQSQAMAEQMEELRSMERRLGHVNKQLKIKVSFKLSLQESRRTGV